MDSVTGTREVSNLLSNILLLLFFDFFLWLLPQDHSDSYILGLDMALNCITLKTSLWRIVGGGGGEVLLTKEPGIAEHVCFSEGFIAVKRHHDHGNSYKGKHFIEAGLQIQRFNPISPGQEAWWHTGRHGVGKVAESLHLDPQVAGK